MQADPDQPGYRHLIFRPQPVKEMDRVSYYNRTPYGEGGISWEKGADTFTMQVTVPVSCHATVHVPASDPSKVFEVKSRTDEVTGILFKGMEEGYAVYEVESGSYNFIVQ